LFHPTLFKISKDNLTVCIPDHLDTPAPTFRISQHLILLTSIDETIAAFLRCAALHSLLNAATSSPTQFRRQ
jgi:hypothetical protein